MPQSKADTKQAMAPITYYGLDTSLKTIEHGVVSKEEAIQIVDKFAAMQVGLQGTREEVVSKSMFGFSLDERKFIEIAMETDAKFRVKLEMLGRLWGVYQKEITIEPLTKLYDIVGHFFTMPVDEFKKYFETLR
jgi:hypothetical protein